MLCFQNAHTPYFHDQSLQPRYKPFLRFTHRGSSDPISRPRDHAGTGIPLSMRVEKVLLDCQQSFACTSIGRLCTHQHQSIETSSFLTAAILKPQPLWTTDIVSVAGNSNEETQDGTSKAHFLSQMIGPTTIITWSKLLSTIDCFWRTPTSANKSDINQQAARVRPHNAGLRLITLCLITGDVDQSRNVDHSRTQLRSRFILVCEQ